MDSTSFPADRDIKDFVSRLGEFRETLNRSEQRLLDSMYLAAIGPDGNDADVQPFSIAFPSSTSGPTLAATPWHAAFRSYS